VLVSLCELVVRLVGQTLSLSVVLWLFYSPRMGSYINTRGPTSGPKVVGTLYSNLGTTG
jgi:hypothetical protein